jgi:hypothetical protein
MTIIQLKMKFNKIQDIKKTVITFMPASMYKDLFITETSSRMTAIVSEEVNQVQNCENLKL